MLPWVSEGNPKWIGVHKFFDDPDYIGAEYERDENGENKDILLEWATKDIGLRATLFALQDVLTQGEYERGTAYILRENSHTDEALQFFCPSNTRRTRIMGGGVVRLEGNPQDMVAEILESEDDGSVHAFGFDNEDVEISYHKVWPKSFHDIPTNGIFMFEKEKGALSRMVVDECIAATAREGLLADVVQTLDEFGEHIPGLRR